MSLRKSKSLCGSDLVRRLGEVLKVLKFCPTVLGLLLYSVTFCISYQNWKKVVEEKFGCGCVLVCARAHCGLVCHTGRRLLVEGKEESWAERMVGLLLTVSPVARNSQVCHHLSECPGTHTHINKHMHTDTHSWAGCDGRGWCTWHWACQACGGGETILPLHGLLSCCRQ